jgi:hypothetical protein
MKRTLTFAAALTLGAAAFLPLPAMAQAGLSIFVNAAPPAPRYESIPAPRTGQVWAPGFWNWDGGRHVWVAGHWETARNGYQYQRTEWARDNSGWRLNRGGWQQVAQASGGDYNMIRIAPPQPRYERTPRARRGQIWIPGYWNWSGNRHEWVRGTWMRERPGYVYEQPRWMERNGQWYFEQGRWEQPRRGHGRDRDRDGIPDRLEGGADRDRDGVPDRLERRDGDRDGVPDAYDRDRDNDGVRNRNDADRDGDGYRNENDRFPDDPRRN